MVFPIHCHFAQHPIMTLIALWFSNPLVPDFGSQFIVSLILGLILPSFLMDPIYNFMQKISIVQKFEKFLMKSKRLKKLIKSKHERVRTIIPRIIAGYLLTYIIALSILAYLCLF